MSRSRAYALLAVACAAPRLGILLHERGAIVAGYAEKSDIFAQTFVRHGTYGFLPGEPSAYTQPLYGWFLVPVYWIFGRHWLSIGLAQLVLALATACLVYEIGRRIFRSTRIALLAAAVTTLHPYLAWHDMHVNREIVDQVCAAALVLLTLKTAERPSKRLAVLTGVVAGLAMLGNTRLVFFPIVCAGYLLWRLPRTRAAAVVVVLVLAGAGAAVAPWLVRNKADVGCWTITTDGLALWKANNSQTYGLLTSGQWIDDVKNQPTPPAPNQYRPDDAYTLYTRGEIARAHRIYPNECAAMTFWEHQSEHFWENHPGAKGKLMLLSAKLLWQPNVLETTGRQGKGTQLDAGRRLVEPAYMWALYALAAVGLFLAPRSFVALALLIFGYQTVCAFAFVGATRYRIAWDFLVVLLATATVERVAARLQR